MLIIVANLLGFYCFLTNIERIYRLKGLAKVDQSGFEAVFIICSNHLVSSRKAIIQKSF
jgi:hypothetical protein